MMELWIQTLRQMEERVFWAEVQAAFARNVATAEDSAETAQWDQASEADFRGEQW